ncbi:MAG: Na+/H+ antiporter subunit C [Burkholderiaceae bacterium]
MEFLVASALAVVTACGVFLILRGRTVPVIIGLSLLGYAVNFYIFVMGRLVLDAPPILGERGLPMADPLPQALVLTAIVIGFGMTGFIVELALRAYRETRSDHVDAGRGLPGAAPIELDVEHREAEFLDDRRAVALAGGDVGAAANAMLVRDPAAIARDAEGPADARRRPDAGRDQDGGADDGAPR